MEFFLISLLQDCTDGCSIKKKLTSYESGLKRNSKEKLAVQVLLIISEDEVIASMKTFLQDRFEDCLLDMENWLKDNSTPLIDPISRSIFTEPVILKESKNTYEKESIIRWLSQNHTDPLTNESLSDKSYISNYQVKSMVSEFIEKFVKGAKDMIHFFVRLYPILVSFSGEERMKGWVERMGSIIEDSREFSKNRVALVKYVARFYKTIGDEENQRIVSEILLEEYMKKEENQECLPLLNDLIRLWSHDPIRSQKFIFLFLRCHQQLHNHSEVVRSLIKYSRYLEVATEQNTLLKYQSKYPKSVKLLEYMSTRDIFSPQLASHFLYKISELRKSESSAIERRIELLESSLKLCPDHHFARTALLELVKKSDHEYHHEKCMEQSRYLHDWYQLRRRKKDMLRLCLSCDKKDDVCRRRIIKYELEDERYKEANLLIQVGGSRFGSWGTQLLMEHLSVKSKDLSTMKSMMHKLMKDVSESRILSKYDVEDIPALVDKLGFEVAPAGIVRVFPKEQQIRRRRRRRRRMKEDGNDDDDDVHDKLVEILSSLSITRLDISGLSLRTRERMELKRTMKSIQFDTLMMSKCQLGDHQLDWLRTMDPTVLRVVDLSKNSIGECGLEVVTKWLRKSIRLEMVNLSDNNTNNNKKKSGKSGNFIDHLVGLLFEVETIKELNVSGNNLEFLDLVWLVEVANCRGSLKRIDVSRNSVTKKEERTISYVAKHCVLRFDSMEK